MQTTTKTPLEAKVIAQNRVNQARNDQFKAITAALLPFVGKRIQKVDGSLRQEVRNALPAVPASIDRHIPHANGSLCFAFKTSEHYREFTVTYAENYAYVATLDNGLLVSVKPASEFEAFRTDYTAQEVIGLRKVYEAANEAARKAESALSPFGTYDRL